MSTASLWEITIKIKLDKLKLGIELKEFGIILMENDIRILPITLEHLIEFLNLEDLHNDPFDKLIIAQAKSEQMGLISRDSNFKHYSGIDLIW